MQYGRQWYVLKTKPHIERQVTSVLESRGLMVYLPLLSRRRRPEPLFPGYLFLKIDCRTDEFLRSRSAPGVSYFLRADGVPVPIMESLIDEIRRRTDRENSLSPADRFSHGDRVLVTAGPFRGIEAVFDRALTAQGRCLILLHMLGRLANVQVDAGQFTKITA
ncbi:MAG: transcription termination/antitermination NusG family protein [Dehalococcoidia bacterium]|nr:transcription termination/antitermination NusG family protein [Dehalococcoidia bacterium]